MGSVMHAARKLVADQSLGKKDVKAVGERQTGENEERNPSGVRLQRCLERQSIVCVVVQDRLTEAKVCDQAHYPSNEPGDGRDVDKPSEDLSAGVGNIEISKQPERLSGKNGCPWHNISICLSEDFRSLSS